MSDIYNVGRIKNDWRKAKCFRLGIIEESLGNQDVLAVLKPYFISQYVENVPEEKICEMLDMLKDVLKMTWYIYAFNEAKLYVVLS